jgi:hypothetical protein
MFNRRLLDAGPRLGLGVVSSEKAAGLNIRSTCLAPRASRNLVSSLSLG